MICTDSTKQYLISRVPAVLILHLKRFQATRYSNRKLGIQVSFPLILDLSPVSENSSSPVIYALYGIVEHSGSIHGGHYVAYVKVRLNFNYFSNFNFTTCIVTILFQSRVPLKPGDHRWSFLPTKEHFESTLSESGSEIDSDDTSSSSATPSKIEAPPGQWYCISDSL